MLNNQKPSSQHHHHHHQQQEQPQQSKIISMISKKSPISSININIPQSMTVFNLKEISSKFKQIKTITSLTDNQKIKSNSNSSTNNLTASSILNVIKNDAIKTEFSNEKILPISMPLTDKTIIRNTNIQSTSSSSLPYHFSEFENLYVCNLCHFTYDSLRSIKAHIWKHSGHSELTYPIIDLNTSKKQQPNDQTATKSITNHISTTSFTTNSSSLASSLASTTTGGICSVLLEVIEKLRDEETKTDNKIKTDATNQTNNKKLLILRRRNSNKISKTKHKLNDKFNCRKIIKNAKHKLRKLNNTNKKQEKKKLIKKLKLNTTKSEIIKECKIETTVLNSLFDDDATLINKDNIYELDTYYNTGSNSFASTSSPSSSLSSSSSSSNDFTKSNDNLLNSDLFNLLSSLANNDGHDEQYVCGLCSYVCYHLPSLKSHMWTHVKNIQFDYSINTSIINAALDYENKLNRKINSFKKANSQLNDCDSNKCMFIQRQLNSALELINYPQQQVSQLASYQANKNSPMVSFRCAKCGFESIDLSLLRLHKREHSK